MIARDGRVEVVMIAASNGLTIGPKK